MGWYQAIIDSLIALSTQGVEGFDPAWAFQTPRYSRELILERECRYFVDAFLNGVAGLNANFEHFEDEFAIIADGALSHAVEGFIHRDMQSRNIMLKGGRWYFIDFQGGRLGPVQYDLASLLIDPYVGLTPAEQDKPPGPWNPAPGADAADRRRTTSGWASSTVPLPATCKSSAPSVFSAPLRPSRISPTLSPRP